MEYEISYSEYFYKLSPPPPKYTKNFLRAQTAGRGIRSLEVRKVVGGEKPRQNLSTEC